MWGKICMEKGKQLPLQERTKKDIYARNSLHIQEETEACSYAHPYTEAYFR